jgi:5-methylcytosine-specific restriction endonuclease McrA
MVISLEKDRNRDTVLSIFHGRCALNPAHVGTQIHEIIPRSLKKNWWVLGNQVLLCPECHDKIHRTGTKQYVDKLVVIVWMMLLEEVPFQRLINEIDF